jgi:topoisomerase-4 subunit A
MISEAKGSKLVDISDDLHPQVRLTFGGRQEGREPELLNAEEFIAKKGVAAKGKKCSAYDLSAVAFDEPLHYPEDEAEETPTGETAPIDIELDDEIPDLPETPSEPASSEAAELLKKDASDEPPIDIDWEPTLF